MKMLMSFALVLALVAGLTSAGRAADASAPTALVDKAIRALGGAEALGKVKAFSTTSKGTLTLDGEDHPITLKSTVQGLDHARGEFEGEFGGDTVRGVTVLAGDKGWRRIMDNVEQLGDDAVANEKRTTYLAVIGATVLPLKDAKFKLEPVADERVNDKPAAGLKVTPPDGKEFRIYFDKESGLPVRMIAKILDFQGNEYTQETTLGEYKPMAGIEKATKITSTRDGQKYVDLQVTKFEVVEKVDPASFEEPK